MASARVVRSAAPRAGADEIRAALANAGKRIVEELSAEQFNIKRWKYEGIRPRPTRSPAQEGWSHAVSPDGRAVVIANAARNRRGEPYVGYIHYASAPKRPTVLDLTRRVRLAAWLSELTEAITRAAMKEAINGD